MLNVTEILTYSLGVMDSMGLRPYITAAVIMTLTVSAYRTFFKS